MAINDEWLQLSNRVRENFDGGVKAFALARDAFFNKFGGAADAATAIANVNRYYAALMPTDFPPKALFGPRPSQDTLAHTAMVGALAKAVALLESVDAVAAKASLIALTDVGTLDIRADVNDTTQFSLHSFGWAIDLNPLSDSNIPTANFPKDLFTLVTGVDVYGPRNEDMRALQPYATLLPLVRMYCNASDAFRAAFVSEAALEGAIAHVFQTTFASSQAAADVAPLAALARAVPVDVGAVHAALAARNIAAAQIARASSFLIGMCQVFAAAAALKKPAVIGNAATLAKYGFVNLHAELIAALSAQEGGGLKWLGAARGAKDPMHFELRSPYPPLS
jgi:hypothetical protein